LQGLSLTCHRLDPEQYWKEEASHCFVCPLHSAGSFKKPELQLGRRQLLPGQAFSVIAASHIFGAGAD